MWKKQMLHAHMHLFIIAVSNGYAQEKEVGIFRDLFCEAGSTITNPEEFAYFFFKPYLGNIAFNEVYNKRASTYFMS